MTEFHLKWTIFKNYFFSEKYLMAASNRKLTFSILSWRHSRPWCQHREYSIWKYVQNKFWSAIRHSQYIFSMKNLVHAKHKGTPDLAFVDSIICSPKTLFYAKFVDAIKQMQQLLMFVTMSTVPYCMKRKYICLFHFLVQQNTAQIPFMQVDDCCFGMWTLNFGLFRTLLWIILFAFQRIHIQNIR